MAKKNVLYVSWAVCINALPVPLLFEAEGLFVYPGLYDRPLLLIQEQHSI